MNRISKFAVGMFALIGGLAFGIVIWFTVFLYLNQNEPPNLNCDWSEAARVWIDENENGLWDHDESPLAGVQVIIDDVNSDDLIPAIAVSDSNGMAELFIAPLNCNVNRTKLFLYAIPPEGYKPTTPWRVIVPEDVVARIAERDFQFGFVER